MKYCWYLKKREVVIFKKGLGRGVILFILGFCFNVKVLNGVFFRVYVIE